MKILIVILLFLSSISNLLADNMIDGYLESSIGISDVKNSDSNEINKNLLSGKAIVQMPKNNELSLNMELTDLDNEAGNNLSNNKGWTALGGKYSFYGVKNWSLGVKGSLDYDHFIEITENKFDFIKYKYDEVGGTLKTKDSYYINTADVGAKFFAEGVYKQTPHLALIFWNELVYDKLESNEPLPHEKFEPTITLTPKIIYEKSPSDSIKFLTELYLENRKYNNRTIDLEGKQKDWYSKFVLIQHLIINAKFNEHLTFQGNNNITFEQLKGNENAQIILKISPRLNYTNKFINAGIAGGEFRFQDEMGMTYDFYEMFAYKLVGKPQWNKLKFSDFWKYEAQAVSVKAFLEWKINKNFIVGEEFAYRSGQWTEYVNADKTNNAFLKENISKTYLKYTTNVAKDLNLNAEMDYTIKKYQESLTIDIEDLNYLTLSLGLKYDL